MTFVIPGNDHERGVPAGGSCALYTVPASNNVVKGCCHGATIVGFANICCYTRSRRSNALWAVPNHQNHLPDLIALSPTPKKRPNLIFAYLLYFGQYIIFIYI